LWDLSSPDLAGTSRELLGHEEGINKLAFSGDGLWLATGSSDKTARLWDLGSENPELNSVMLRGHDGPVNTLAFSPDGEWLATASGDKMVRLWLLPLETLKSMACEGAGRNLTQVEWSQFFPEEEYRKTCQQWP
jgi:WD40 repeat protein